jgi:hypothetical protein
MITDFSERLIVQEVSPRDGLQIEPTWVDTPDKIALIDQLSLAGFSRIEAGSFVSPKAIPALRDGDDVFRGIKRHPGVIYVALIPNLRGAQRAIDAGADELNLVMSASQTHNLANMRMRCEQSLTAFADVVTFAAGHPTAYRPTSSIRWIWIAPSRNSTPSRKTSSGGAAVRSRSNCWLPVKHRWVSSGTAVSMRCSRTPRPWA